MMVLGRVAVFRLARTRRAWWPVLGYALLALIIALVAGRSGGASGSDHVMNGTFRWLIVPLVSYAVVSAALGGVGLKRAVRGVSMLGVAPRRVALETVVVASGAAAVVCGGFGLIVSLLSHGATDPPLAHDVFASTWVSALGGLAYGAYFCAGAAIGSGAVRGLFLAFDWIAGSSPDGVAFFTPRAHLTALMGGDRVWELSSRTSCVVLLSFTVIFTAIAVRFVRRAWSPSRGPLRAGRVESSAHPTT